MIDFFDSQVVSTAIDKICAEQAGLVVLQGSRIVFQSQNPGIRDALWLHDEQPELLRGAIIVDRIIGRAAAILFAHGGAAAVYGRVMSREAMLELQAKGVQTRTNTLTERIINRAGSDICPMEKAILGITDPEEAITRLRVAHLRLCRERM